MLVVLSSLWGSLGGIPAFNRLLVRAAAEYAAACGRRLRVIALTDARDARPASEWLAALPAAALPPDWYVPCGGARARCVLLVARALRRRPLLCLGHVNLAPLGLLGRARGVGYGVVAHGIEVWTRLPPLRRLALRCARAVACVSDDTARCVQRVQGVAAQRCVRVLNALPVAPEELAAPAGAPDAAAAATVHVLSISRLHPGEPKGIDVMLQAIAGLPQVHYTVVGDGAALPALRALAERLGVHARVRFTGALPDDQRDARLRACDLFALPSRCEGFGIVYLEAMAHGKPCLAAAFGGAPEVVVDGETGLVVAPTAAAVRQALAVLCGDAALRARMGAAGRRRVAAGFCYPQFRQRALDFFTRLPYS